MALARAVPLHAHRRVGAQVREAYLQALLEDIEQVANPRGRVYICGSTGVVEHTGQLLQECGYPIEHIHAMRY